MAALASVGAAAPAAPAEFPFVVIPPGITFATKNVPPAAPCYVTPLDRLLISAWNSVPGLILRIDLRMLMPTGEIIQNQWTMPPRTDRSGSYQFYTLAEGYLFSLTVSTQTTAQPGGCYVKADLIRGQSSIEPIGQVLLSGYVPSGPALAWPYPRWVLPCEGPGNLRVITGTDPSAGNPVLETVPTQARWRLLAIRCNLTTNPSAGSRYAALYLVDPAGTFLYLMAQIAQASSQTYNYNWALGVLVTQVTGLPNVTYPLPDQMFLTAGQSFGLIAYGGFSGDDWSAPLYLVEEWLAP
jgi:hypothetical protein